MLVHSQGCVAEICPATSVRMMRAWTANLAELIARVQCRQTFARNTVEAEWSPFVTSSVVAGEQDQRIIEIMGVFEMLNNLPNAFIDAFHHGCKNRHSSRQIAAAFFGKRIPCGVFLA